MVGEKELGRNLLERGSKIEQIVGLEGVGWGMVGDSLTLQISGTSLLSKLTPLSFFCMHCDLNMIASHLKSATRSLADLRIRYWNSNFEHDQKDSQSWLFSSNLKTKVVCSVWPQNCRMAAWLVTSQSAPKDGVLLCEVSHHRPSNKLTSPNQPSLNLNKKITAKILIKRTSLMKRCTV